MAYLERTMRCLRTPRFGAYPLLYLTFFVLSITPASAQISADSDSSGLRLLARPYGDSIVLRWAPTDYLTWREMRRHGVIVERRRVSKDATWETVNAERLIAYDVEDFRTFADLDDPHVIAVAEALHGEATPMPASGNGPLARARDQLEEQQQRFFLAALNADLSPAAARALGWRWTVRPTEPDLRYDYRLRLLGPTPAVSNTVRARATDNYPYAPVLGLSAEEGDGNIELRWSKVRNVGRFSAYHVETSEDGGRTYTRLNEFPLVKSDARGVYTHPIEPVTNYRPRYYRVRGVDAFGELSPPGIAVLAQGRDRSPPARVTLSRVRDEGDGGFTLRWSVSEQRPDLAGYRIKRAASHEGPYRAVHLGTLPPSQRDYLDATAPPHRLAYYVVEAVDTAGNVAKAPPALAVWRDTEPPAAPTGLRGKVDTNGVVFLAWEAGDEPDLHGYRVFVSHARDREFLQVKDSILRQNYCFDSLSLAVTNEVVYYKVAALDRNYNPSDFSAVVALERPDRRPPTAAVLHRYRTYGDSVRIDWRRSSSTDVIRQEIWRREAAGTWTAMAQALATDTSFVDRSVRHNADYAYQIRTVDDAGLVRPSAELRLRNGRTVAATAVELRWVADPTGGGRLEWTRIPEATGYQLYVGAAADQLRPGRRLGEDLTTYLLTGPGAYYAVRPLLADGRPGVVSNVVRVQNP